MALDYAATANVVLDHNVDYLQSLVFANGLCDATGVASENYNGPTGLIPILPTNAGGRDHSYRVKVSSGAAVEFTEYDEPVDATGDAYILCQPGTISIWEQVLTTGFAQDAAHGPEDLYNFLVEGMSEAARSMNDKLSNLLLGSGTNGLLTWIDDTATAGGISRGSYAAHGSYTTDMSTAKITESALATVVDAVISPDRGARKGELEWWTSATQARIYRKLPDGGQRFYPGAGAPMDLTYDADKLSFDGIPIRVIPDLVSSAWLLVHRPSVKIEQIRPLTVKNKFYPGDGDRLLMSWRGKPRVEKTHWCGKLENCATS